MRQLNEQDLNDILNGAAFLASGGGGSRAMGEDIRDWILEEPNPINLIEVDEVQAVDWSVVSFAGGAPSNFEGSASETSLKLNFSSHMLSRQTKNEGKSGGYEIADLKTSIFYPFDLLETTLGQSFSSVMSLEIGTGNTFLALYVAAKKGIPMVDCDGAGRSIPDLSMLTYSSPDLPVYPAAMSNISSNATEIVKSALYTEQVAKTNNLLTDIMQTSEFGDSGVMAAYVMEGSTVTGNTPVMAQTVSEAQGVGATLRQAIEGGEADPVTTLIDWYNTSGNFPDAPRAIELFRGTIETIEHENIGRLDRVTIVLDNGTEKICVLALNENLIACRDSYPFAGEIQDPIAMGPDLICYITPEGLPLTNVEIEEGQELVIVGLKAREKSRQNPSIIQGYDTILSELGYTGGYIPIEDLNPGLSS